MSERELVTKAVGSLDIKDAEQGIVEAVVATLDTVDHDREVIKSTAVRPDGARVKMSFYGHGSVFGDAPVGKGVITPENGKLILRGKFFMSTTRGREAFETVKALGSEGEWSVGFSPLRAVDATDEWKAKGARRVFEEIDLFEVSPVLRGASPNTATIGVKELTPAPEPQADGDATPVGETPAEPAAEVVPDPLEVEAKRLADEEAEMKAKLDADLKAHRDEAMEEYERVQRALKRMGYAA